MISKAEAFTAAAHGRPRDALRHARSTLAYAGALGMTHEHPRWAWPLVAWAPRLRSGRRPPSACHGPDPASAGPLVPGGPPTAATMEKPQ